MLFIDQTFQISMRGPAKFSVNEIQSTLTSAFVEALFDGLLVILTLGLYWPFAAVALARMRLEAVTVKTRVSPDTLVNQMKGAEGDAAGDAAGDLFGLDIGF